MAITLPLFIRELINSAFILGIVTTHLTIEPIMDTNEWETRVASAGPRHAAEILELKVMK